MRGEALPWQACNGKRLGASGQLTLAYLHFTPPNLRFVAIYWRVAVQPGTVHGIDFWSLCMQTTLKTLHLLGVCLFIGNIIVSGFWKAMADRLDDLAVARFATRLVNLTDAVFTGLGATLLMAAGHAMAGQHGGIATNPWIVWSYAAFGCCATLAAPCLPTTSAWPACGLWLA
jgi:hypothetical protein